MRHSIFLNTGAAILALVTVSPAFAQTAAPAPADPTAANPPAPPQVGIADIVVTAQRRSENLQKAALAISAVSGNTLISAGVTRPDQLTSVIPSLQVATPAGPYSIFYLRGVGNFNGNALSDAAVSFNVDGVYLGRPSSTTGFFYDLERVEVLKGPQGTLYGRNATGGAINVITHKPDLGVYAGDLTAEYGNYNAVRVDGAINVPIGDNAALRASGIYVRHDGYMNDGTDDQNDYGGRLSLRVDPVSNLKIVVTGDYFHQGGKGAGATPLALGIDNRIGIESAQGQAYYESQPNTLDGRTFRPLDFALYQRNHYWGISSTIDWTVSIGTFTFVPSHREGNLNFQTDASGFYIHQQEKDIQSSFEARFATDNTKPLRLIAGMFFYDENVDEPVLEYIHQSNDNYQTFTTNDKSMAAFGRLTYAITPAIRFTAGARYTTEDKHLNGTLISDSVVCVLPTSYYPTYVPGCPTAAGQPYIATPPAPPNFIPGADGTITTQSRINSTGANAKYASFEKFTYRLAADWDVTPQNLLYASYETGFKSGGFFFSTDAGVYQPEQINASTIGSKNRFFDRRLQLNVEAFYWRYSNQQISHLGTDSAGIAIFPTENVGRATMKGAEADLQLLATTTTLLTADVQFLDAKYNSFVYNQPNFNGGVSNGTACPTIGTPGAVYVVDCSGNRPPNAPRWTINLGAQQTIPLGDAGKIVLNARSHYQTESLTGLEFTSVEMQPSYWTADFQASFVAHNDRFTVSGFINNAFNKTILGESFPPPFSLFTVGTLRPPRTFGVRAGVKF